MLQQPNEASLIIIRKRSGEARQYIHITYLTGLFPDRRDRPQETPPVSFLVEQECV